MPVSMNALLGRIVHAYDGAIGKVSDFYFDTEEWTTRYFVIAPSELTQGNWLLLPPVTLSWADTHERELCLHCTRQEIMEAQATSFDEVISRREEDAIFKHFEMQKDHPPGLELPQSYGVRFTGSLTDDVLAKLHSFCELQGCSVESDNYETGTATEILLEDTHWDQQWLVLKMKDQETLRLLPITLVNSVQWASKVIAVDVSAETIQNAPEVSGQQAFDTTFIQEVSAYYQGAV